MSSDGAEPTRDPGAEGDTKRRDTAAAGLVVVAVLLGLGGYLAWWGGAGLWST